MGGVINIITRRQHEEGRSTQARVMYGSYNTQKYMINNGYNVGRFSSFVSLNHDRTDGHRPNSEFQITNGFAKLGYTISDRFKATGDVSLAKYKNQNPGKVTAPIRDNTMDILRGTTSFALENTFGNSSGAIRAFYNWGDHEINDGLPMTSSAMNRGYLFRRTTITTGCFCTNLSACFRAISSQWVSTIRTGADMPGTTALLVRIRSWWTNP